jgi:hypothetical protein
VAQIGPVLNSALSESQTKTFKASTNCKDYVNYSLCNSNPNHFEAKKYTIAEGKQIMLSYRALDKTTKAGPL